MAEWGQFGCEWGVKCLSGLGSFIIQSTCSQFVSTSMNTLCFIRRYIYQGISTDVMHTYPSESVFPQKRGPVIGTSKVIELSTDVQRLQ